MIEFKTLVMKDEVTAALALLPNIPEDQLNNAARFLEAKGHPDKALGIATDPHYKFDLAIQLGDLETAHGIATSLDSAPKWKQLGELAMSSGQLKVAETCLWSAQDYSGLMLLYSCQGNREGLSTLAAKAIEGSKHNVAFLALFLLGRPEECSDLLVATGRYPEAAFFCRTYLPSRMSDVCKVWKKDLEKINPKAAESLADPAEYPNLFPDLDLALKAESYAASLRAAGVPPAAAYAQFEGSAMRNLIAEVRQMEASGGTLKSAAAVVAEADHEEEEEVEIEEEEEEVEVEEEEEEEEVTHTSSSPPAPPSAPIAPPPPPPTPPKAPEPEPEPEEEEEEVVEVEEEEEEELFGDAGEGEGGEAPADGDGDDDDWGLDDDEEK